MRIHILGICGTFMASLALLARAAGHSVTGVDAQAYPPMSDLLAREGIALEEGYDRDLPDPAPELIVIGNALSRGNPLVETVLRWGLPYRSGAEWLAQEILQGRWVLAVAGTHWYYAKLLAFKHPLQYGTQRSAGTMANASP